MAWAAQARKSFSRLVWVTAPTAAAFGLGPVAWVLAAAFPLVAWLIWTAEPDRLI